MRSRSSVNESIMVDSGISAICLTAYDMEEKQYRKFHPAPHFAEMSDALGMQIWNFRCFWPTIQNYFRQYSSGV